MYLGRRWVAVEYIQAGFCCDDQTGLLVVIERADRQNDKKKGKTSNKKKDC